MSLREALGWVLFWIIMSLLFCLFIYFYMGTGSALTWLSAYMVEKLLSFDNLFMFHVIFGFFKTQPEQQRKALNWGMIGAIVLRGLFMLGAIGAFAFAPWLIYLCGAFLLFTGLKTFFSKNDEADEDAPTGLVAKLKKWFPRLSIFLITVLTIEFTDLLFAMDSLPAAISITTDPILLATSNLAAVLGLRSMFFVMQAAIKKWHFLDKGVAIILSGLGAKILLASLILVPTPYTFAFIAGVMLISIILSMMKEYANKPLIENEQPSIAKRFCTFFFRPEYPNLHLKLEEEKPNQSQPLTLGV